jgi:hypothetical protein
MCNHLPELGVFCALEVNAIEGAIANEVLLQPMNFVRRVLDRLQGKGTRCRF